MDSCSGGGGLPPASAMINTVEDMTGTFSSQFAHEIIKSMDEGTLFNFEENLVCSFDIDQLDDATSDVSRIILFQCLFFLESFYCFPYGKLLPFSNF